MKNLQLPLKKDRSRPRDHFSLHIGWRKSLPFVFNPRGALVHRPISVTTIDRNEYDRNDYADYFCGNASCGGYRGLTFYGQVPEGMVVCKRCEEKAVAAGLPSNADLHDYHVCVGGLKVHAECCNTLTDTSNDEAGQ